MERGGKMGKSEGEVKSWCCGMGMGESGRGRLSVGVEWEMEGVECGGKPPSWGRMFGVT